MIVSTEASEASQTLRADRVSLRKPVPEDGLSLHALVAASPPLDANSSYCNLLQCSYFADTAIAADVDNQLAGFVSGFWSQRTPQTLFVWQIVVGESWRGQRLAQRMLSALVERLSSHSLRFIETTITPDNQTSWKVFERLAQALNAPLVADTLFDKDRHFRGQHPDEVLVRIGPIF